MFHEKTSCLNLQQFPPTSNIIKLHIYGVYRQQYIWYHVAIEGTINIDPELYGFTCNEDKNLVSIINDASPLPEDFSFPCKCTRCKFDNRYPCRLKEFDKRCPC